jgi:hypothetical protein
VGSEKGWHRHTSGSSLGKHILILSLAHNHTSCR